VVSLILHDWDKFLPHNFAAGAAFLFGDQLDIRNLSDWNQTCLRHFKRNKHHFQYWILIREDIPELGFQPLEIPEEHLMELLADWFAAGKFYGLSAWDWYRRNKQTILLHDKTRAIIERYLSDVERRKRVNAA
jgi:hypothetical protein